MKPRLILDCDGVILEFIAPFTRWLAQEHGIRMQLSGPTIASSLTRLSDGAAVDDARFPVLLNGFFETGLFTQPPTPGAKSALASLAADMEIVVLTNLPAQWRDQRVASLRNHGFDFPVVVNDGPKGPRVLELANGRPAVFVDDLPSHHRSAARHAPDVGRLHMVGDPALGTLMPEGGDAHARIDDWVRAEPWIRKRMEG